jgi:asparagine synthase (glutamine-hydrolysing)
MSMASGLEVRVPYLDHELVETVMAIPGQLKLSPEINKPLLVAASPELPRSAVRRPKMGFQLPFDAWLRGALKDRVTEAVYSPHLAGALGLIPRELERIWTEFQARSSDLNAQRIWSIAALLLWCQENALVY